MRKRIVKDLQCPNTSKKGFIAFATEVNRNGTLLSSKLLSHEELEEHDDIKEGLLIQSEKQIVYPIHNFIASLFSDSEVNEEFYIQKIQKMLPKVPQEYQGILKDNIQRLSSLEETEARAWIKRDMEYYDSAVKGKDWLEQSLFDVRHVNTWHMYLERERHLFRYLPRNLHRVLEIGCGNGRTVYKVYRPEKYDYQYYGTDISLHKLIIAKNLIPEGDFIQCSALNIPFEDGFFDALLAFGVLHHLVDPLFAFEHSMAKMHSSGLFLLTEPICKEKLLEGKRFRLAKTLIRKLFTTYEHSENDREIDLDNFLEKLQKYGGVIHNKYFFGTIIRTILARLLVLSPHLNHRKYIWQNLIFLDRMFYQAFCKQANSLGPSGVHMVLGKNRA